MILVLGKGVANDGVIKLYNKYDVKYEYLNIDEVIHYKYEYVVKAPGIPMYNEIIDRFVKLGIKVITDIEVGLMYSDKFFIGVTGSNGKTTTSTLIYNILSRKYNVSLCGNIGYSLCEAIVNEKSDIYVVELSSFQLECVKVNLDISILLNIVPHHLDHHRGYREYINAKENICYYQDDKKLFIYNFDDLICRDISLKKHKCLGFSYNSRSDCYYLEDNIYYKDKFIMKISNSESLIYDVMASILCCLEFEKITIEDIIYVVRDFKGVEYRFNKVNDCIYNDAKSTNPYSTISALKNLENVFLICGGYDRKEDLNCLNNYLGKITSVFCYGESKDKIYDYMISNNIDCHRFNNLEEVIDFVFSVRTNEIILYSPMFASFDQFNSYIDRGNLFDKLCKKYL